MKSMPTETTTLVKTKTKTKTKSGAPPVRYAGGVIYTSVKMKAFRVLTTAGDNYSEVPVRWKGSLPTQASWKKAVDAIDEARKTK